VLLLPWRVPPSQPNILSEADAARGTLTRNGTRLKILGLANDPGPPPDSFDVQRESTHRSLQRDPLLAEHIKRLRTVPGGPDHNANLGTGNWGGLAFPLDSRRH
jgi:hypothetical protein